MKKFLVPLLLAAVAVVLGTCAFLFVGERRVDARMSRLVKPIDSSAQVSEILHSRLVGIDAYLDQRARARDAFGAPGMWTPDRRTELEQGLASLGTFFEQVDDLLSDPSCRHVLEKGTIAAVDAPRLGLSRHRTNVLCAKALVEFDRPDGSRSAAKRLGQALDMIRLGDDGRLFGYAVSNAEECIVLQALQKILLRPDGDVAAINEVLGDRLDRIARDNRAETALSRDLADFRERSRPLAERGWMAPWRGIGELMEGRRLANCWEESFRLVQGSNPESRRSLDAFVDRQGCEQGRFPLSFANDSHVFRTRVELAHAALDLAEQLRNPATPSTSSPFHVVEAGDHVELRAEDALAALEVEPGDPGAYLLCWTIPR
jgi:hypothetical protein